jgi:hypothetical protein
MAVGVCGVLGRGNGGGARRGFGSGGSNSFYFGDPSAQWFVALLFTLASGCQRGPAIWLRVLRCRSRFRHDHPFVCSST